MLSQARLGVQAYEDMKRRMMEFQGYYNQRIALLLVNTDNALLSLQVYVCIYADIRIQCIMNTYMYICIYTYNIYIYI